VPTGCLWVGVGVDELGVGEEQRGCWDWVSCHLCCWTRRKVLWSLTSRTSRKHLGRPQGVCIHAGTLTRRESHWNAKPQHWATGPRTESTTSARGLSNLLLRVHLKSISTTINRLRFNLAGPMFPVSGLSHTGRQRCTKGYKTSNPSTSSAV